MGGFLNQLARRSDDPANPSADVGTVKLFENERIRVWDMCVETSGEAARTGWHKHEHDYIFLQIGEGLCTVDRMDPHTGEVTRTGVQKVAAKSCNWRTASKSAPAVHQLHNASPTNNYRQILVEFLEDKPRYSPDQVAKVLGNAVLTTNVGSELLFENDRCRVHDFSIAPHSGQDLPWHHHTLPYFFVNTCGGPNNPGKGLHGLQGNIVGSDGKKKTVELWSQDRDMTFNDISNGGFNEKGMPIHMDKVWNHLDVPYCSFIVEIK